MLEDFYRLLQNGSEFHINDDLFEIQDTVLDFLEDLQDFLEEDKVVKNDFIWKIIDLLLHKKVMNLRYFGTIRNSSKQKKYAMKYYTFLIHTLIKIIEMVINGITYKELISLQKFIAYVYFRFSWVQKHVIQSLAKETDPQFS